MQIARSGILVAARLAYFSVSISYGFMPTSITTGDPGGLEPDLRSAPLPVISARPVSAAFPVIVGIGVGWFIPASMFPSMYSAARNAIMKEFSDAGPRIFMPVNQEPDERLFPRSSVTVIPPVFNAAMISVAIAMLSPSLEYVETVTEWPENPFKRSAIFFCWSRVSLRGATNTSSLWRSSRSDSAARFASAAPRCASAMRASAVANFATASRTDALANATVASAVLMRAWSSAICLSYPLTDAFADSAVARAIAASFSLTEALSFARSAWRCAATKDMLLNSWSHRSAVETSPSHTPSPTTPMTISTHPILDRPLTHLLRRCLTNIHTGATRRSQRHLAMVSDSSRITPIATAAVHISNHIKYASCSVCKSRFVTSSISDADGVDTHETDIVICFIWFAIVIGTVQAIILIGALYAAIDSRRSSASHAATKSDTSQR